MQCARFQLKCKREALFVLLLVLMFNIPARSQESKKSVVKNARPVPEFSVPPQERGMAYVYFAAIGDQGTGEAGQYRVAHLMNQKAQQDGLHFVLTLGDNIYPSGVSSTEDPQWQEKFENVYNLPKLNVPFYASLGNHDHKKGRARFQVEYSKKNPKWRMPEAYYTFTIPIDSTNQIQFFALDTEPIVEKDASAAEQLSWLEQALSKSNATWKIVFGHHPVFSFGKHGHEKEMIDRVRPLLEKYHVDLYLCGHDHDRQLLQPVNGVQYVVSGTGGKSRGTRYAEKTVFAATNLGYAWFRVSPEEFHLQFINGEGKIEFAHTWQKGTIAMKPFIAEEWKIKKEKKKKNKNDKKKKRKKKKRKKRKESRQGEI